MCRWPLEGHRKLFEIAILWTWKDTNPGWSFEDNAIFRWWKLNFISNHLVHLFISLPQLWCWIKYSTKSKSTPLVNFCKKILSDLVANSTGNASYYMSYESCLVWNRSNRKIAIKSIWMLRIQIWKKVVIEIFLR